MFVFANMRNQRTELLNRVEETRPPRKCVVKTGKLGNDDTISSHTIENQLVERQVDFVFLILEPNYDRTQQRAVLQIKWTARILPRQSATFYLPL